MKGGTLFIFIFILNITQGSKESSPQTLTSMIVTGYAHWLHSSVLDHISTLPGARVVATSSRDIAEGSREQSVFRPLLLCYLNSVLLLKMLLSD